MQKNVKKFYPKTVNEWRDWLVKNHEKERNIAVIRYKKHTKKLSPSHIELMHEAICFGWIDTTVKGINNEKYLINFVKRNEKSRWSDNTLKYAKSLLEQGKMSPQGIKFYEEGRMKPTHDFGIPKNPTMPQELKKALDKYKKAKENFEKSAPSYKKTMYRWILRGKLEETRKKRINTLIKSLH